MCVQVYHNWLIALRTYLLPAKDILSTKGHKTKIPIFFSVFLANDPVPF